MYTGNADLSQYSVKSQNITSTCVRDELCVGTRQRKIEIIISDQIYQKRVNIIHNGFERRRCKN